MKHLLRAILLCLALGAAPPLCAQQTDTPPALEIVPGEPATLVYWNRPIIVMRATVRGFAPAERAERAVRRLEEVPPGVPQEAIQAMPAKLGPVEGTAVLAGNAMLFFVFPEDTDATSGETAELVAQAAAVALRDALAARDAQKQPELLLRAALSVAAATAALALILWALGRARRLTARLIESFESRFPRPVFGFALWRHIADLERYLSRGVILLAQLFAVYLWLTFVLSRFPYTAPWGGRLGGYLVQLAAELGRGALHAVPGLFAVLVILLAARYLTRLASALFGRIEQGRTAVGWLDPETARATRRIVVVLLWLFAIIVAYPYIPGSDSAAFKGVSVFAGLMLTLGSTGFVSHLLSGFVVVYSRTLRTGEMVKVGDTMGTVSEVGALATRIVTARGEEMSIPNSVLVGTTVTNYSRRGGESGALLCTTVTIGYDAPWRQVHAMLLLAAARTAGLRTEPAPNVLQRSLSDFYVQYELRANLQRTEDWFVVQSALNGQIQDVFNEFGVQIMSPHFMVQPDKSVVVPKFQWHAPPAQPEPAPRAAKGDGA
jgi:small-conductance mechanosensitive channel